MTKVLIIGGTGNISWNLSMQCHEQGHQVWVMTRKSQTPFRRLLPNGIKVFCADIREKEAVNDALAGMTFDVIVDFVCYNTEHAMNAVRIFGSKTAQYIFISTTAVYSRPAKSLPYREDSVADVIEWEYARNKSDAEAYFLKMYESYSFPVTIVRAGHTYDTVLPVAVGPADWTVPGRILAGKPIVIHGDGTTLWTLTHAYDFCRALVGLFCNESTLGEAYHITSDEQLTWNQITEQLVITLGVSTAEFVYIPSKTIYRLDNYLGAGITGHKMWCDIYNNAKIKSVVKNWSAKIGIKEGLKSSVEWYMRNDLARTVRKDFDNYLDVLSGLGEHTSFRP